MKIVFVLMVLFSIVACDKEKGKEKIVSLPYVKNERNEDSLGLDNGVSIPVEYSFFVAGHVYGSINVNNEGVHPPFKAKFEILKHDDSLAFGVFTGDIVVESTAKNWNEIDDDISALGVPVYFAVGNHDIENRALFESRYGPTYFSFKEGEDLFIVLDPNLDGWNISGDQLTFLQTVLKANIGCRNVFVFCHQVIWRTDDNVFSSLIVNSLEGKADETNFWSEVEPLFSALESNTYFFAGDVGGFISNTEVTYYKADNGLTYISSGMGGGVRDNFVIVQVSPEGEVYFDLIALNCKHDESLGPLESQVLE